MLFNSLEFALFLPVVFFAYWFVVRGNLKAQNILMLAASYLFYGWWDWRFLLLLVLLSLTNYLIGTGISRYRENKAGRVLLVSGLIMNIGVLAFFKYFNFFIESFIDLVALTGYSLPQTTLNVILPLGISFYIFLSISYIVDIYKKEIEADRNIVDVLLTLSFFPIILAGPIQRPKTLLPQIKSRREFSYDLAIDGLRQILWGLFAKIAIADTLNPVVEDVFENYQIYSGSTLAIGAFFFTVQIYADFSGYSNIAIGVGKLFGFRLMQNFAYPYFARDITEFWKRWHISLTTWFRDYVFLPLSFRISYSIRTPRVLRIRSDHFIYIVAGLVTWFLTGLWHGANYTFIVWGMINGLLLILYHLQRNTRRKLFKKFGIDNNHKAIALTEGILTIFMIIISWIFFRSKSLPDASIYIDRLFSKSLFSVPEIFIEGLQSVVSSSLLILMILVYFFLEWKGRDDENVISLPDPGISRPLRWSVYFSLMLLILFLSGNNQQFIYFQF